MRLIGSRNATREDFETVMQAVKSGAVDTRAMRTHSVPVDQLPGEFVYLLHDRQTVIKAIVEMK
jgi:threonine dehydrogenase-like Zn-dependent dehydrogenase